MASLRIHLAFASALAACSGSSDDTGGSASSETSATTATMSTTAATSESSSGSTGATTTTTGESSTSTSSESGPVESSGADSSSTAGLDACEPHGGDDECGACAREMCCPQLHGCVDNPDCAAVYACLAGNDSPSVSQQMTCAEDEGVDYTMISAFLQQVLQCRAALCAEQCPD